MFRGGKTMSRMSKFATGTAGALAAVVLAALPAVAASQYLDSVSGIEVSATSTEGVFAGTAGGDLPGYWAATVDHTPLSGNPQTATIDGGSFDLLTVLHNKATHVVGSFTGGSVVQTGGFSGCVDQTYSVNGQLGDVGVYGRPDHGTGTFTATLTHYRISIDGYCIIYAASIAGTVLLDF
jgi:hypothetical protein